MISQAKSPWKHNAEREQEMQLFGGVGDEFIVFERAAGDGIDAVGLVLGSKPNGFEVVNIVPLQMGELGRHGYNLALEDFINLVAAPAIKGSGFRLRTTKAMQGLGDWLPPQAETSLKVFLDYANKSIGSSHPGDEKRWFKFLLSVSNRAGSFDQNRLHRWLIADGWGQGTAEKLVEQYEFGLALLRAQKNQIS